MKKVDILLKDTKDIQDKLYNEVYESREKISLYNYFILLIREAAYRGSEIAQFELGQHYEEINFFGENPSYSPEKCVYWYAKACEMDHAEACNCLANYYELGEGVDKNLDKALSLYKKAASLGSSSGKENYELLLKELNPPLV